MQQESREAKIEKHISDVLYVQKKKVPLYDKLDRR